MRGSPFLQLLVASLALAGAGFSVAWVASPAVRRTDSTRIVEPQVGGVRESLDLHLVVWSPAPVSLFRLRAGERVLVEKTNPGEVFEVSVLLPEQEGRDPVIEAFWEDRQWRPVALKLQIFLAGREIASKSLWGKGSIVDVLDLPFGSPEK